MSEGFNLRHATDKSCVRVTPIMSQPIPTPYGQKPKICNVCQIHHPFKAIHFWIGPNGEVMVSKGVLELLRLVGKSDGMEPMDGFTLESSTDAPPPLKVAQRGADRAKIDHENRSTVMYASTIKEAVDG